MGRVLARGGGGGGGGVSGELGLKVAGVRVRARGAYQPAI